MRAALKIAILCLCAAVAQADEQNEARTLFKEGNRLLDAGDYVGALDMFKGAYSRWPNVKILLNLGTALRQLGRNVEAAENYEKYLNDSQADPAKKPQVEAILKEISAKLGKLRIEVNEPGARVVIDGRPVGGSPQSFTLRVEPGSHSVVAEKEGYPLSAATVSVAAGEERAVELRLTGAAPKPETPPPPTETKPAIVETPPVDETKPEVLAEDREVLAAHGRTKTIAGAALIGVGVAALAAGIAMGVIAKQAGDSITGTAMSGGTYDSAKYSAGQTDQYAADALYAVGAVATVAGVVVLVLGRREVSKSRAQVTPSVSPHAVGATLRLTF